MPIDSHLPQADPFSLVPTFKVGNRLIGQKIYRRRYKSLFERQETLFYARAAIGKFERSDSIFFFLVQARTAILKLERSDAIFYSHFRPALPWETWMSWRHFFHFILGLRCHAETWKIRRQFISYFRPVLSCRNLKDLTPLNFLI